MKRIVAVLGLTLAAALISGIASAAPTNDPAIQQREQNQQQRIQQGINSGQLTPREAGHLEAREAKIAQDESRMKSDGKLTRAERRKLTREQNRASRSIYRKKHNERAVDVK